jgi:ribosomal protein L13E
MAAYALARSPQEKALRRLFKQLSGRKWRRQRNWREDTRKTPLGEWHGVTVNGDGNVVALQLAQNRLEGDFDAWARRNLGKLPKLVLCNVGGNPKLECVSASVGALEARGDGVAGKMFIQGAGAEALKAAGFSLAELKVAGFSAEELKAAGFPAAELKAAGFSSDELEAAGFSSDELVAAGIGSYPV